MGTLQGVPCPWGSASRPPYLLDRGPLPWPTPMAELPSWGAPGGRLRGLVLVFRRSFLLGRSGLFLRIPSCYRYHVLAIVLLGDPLLVTKALPLVVLDLVIVRPSYEG